MKTNAICSHLFVDAKKLISENREYNVDRKAWEGCGEEGWREGC
jgi:hypothetical protein